jgi:transcriptional regulator PpsR
VNDRPGGSADTSALSGLAPELAATFVKLASDIALVIDAGGVIRSVAQGRGEPLAPSAETWVGRTWVDTVTPDTRRKIELLLQEVAATGVARKREVNQLGAGGCAIPVAWSAVRLGAQGPVLAVGHDLRAVAAIQQRFIAAQQQIERGYWQRRQAEEHERTLFQVATDAVLMVDAPTLRVLDVNQAALRLFDLQLDDLVGRPAADWIDRMSRPVVEDLLATARATGQAGAIRARLLGRRTVVSLSATPLRAGDHLLLMLRARALNATPSQPDADDPAPELLARAPEAVVVTDCSGRVQLANLVFLALAQVDQAQACGRPLADWVGTAELPLAAVLSAARHRGMASRCVSAVRGASTGLTRVELCAVVLPDGDQERVGFTLRPAGADPAGTGAQPTGGQLASEPGLPVAAGVPAGLPDPAHGPDALAGTIQRLARQLGQAGLPQLLRVVSDRAERLFIETALARADGDVLAAAAVLAISPDNLALRLRRLDGEAGLRLAGGSAERPDG